jgi:predicted transcriptional regulator
MARYGEKKEITGVKLNRMTVRQIAEELELRVYTGKKNLDIEVSGAYVSDLLSDVMGNAGEGEVWITLQSHLNVVAIASLKELAAVVLVKGIEPNEQVLVKANEEGVPILGTSNKTFETAGELFKMLNK